MKKPLTVPKLNPNDPVVELAMWYKKAGEKVEVGDPLCDFATTKATFTFDSTEAGFLQPNAPAMSRLNVGEIFAWVCDTKEEALRPEPNAPARDKAPSAVTFSRKAKEKMVELGLQDSDFKGHAFVTEKMVLNRGRSAGAASLSMLKEKEIEALVQGASALRSSLTILADAQLLLLRRDNHGVSPQATLAWAAAQVFKEQPRFLSRFRAGVDPSAPLDIGYALDMGSGTRSFLARDCVSWDSRRWHEQITDWGLRLIRNKVEVAELGSGAVTVTDLTSEGIFSFEPLLVGDQSTILGFAGDLQAEAPQVSLTMAFDHRVHNGRQAAEFLKALKNRISALGENLENARP